MASNEDESCSKGIARGCYDLKNGAIRLFKKVFCCFPVKTKHMEELVDQDVESGAVELQGAPVAVVETSTVVAAVADTSSSSVPKPGTVSRTPAEGSSAAGPVDSALTSTVVAPVAVATTALKRKNSYKDFSKLDSKKAAISTGDNAAATLPDMHDADWEKLDSPSDWIDAEILLSGAVATSGL